jgi:2-amino-4-hydroxy-6-hydroxymethyldihydropteridine diphosphokinase
MADVYIGLGSNVGNRTVHLTRARVAIASRAGAILAESSIYDTAPWGPVPQDNYLNQVIRISTELSPHDLLNTLHEIERAAGRDRGREERYGPRTLDLDILLYGDRAVQEDGLVIPHPRIAERAFVLVPLAEIAPDLVLSKTPIHELLGRIDSGTVARYDPI